MKQPTREELISATENLGKRADLELMLIVIRSPPELAKKWHAIWRERYPVADLDIHAMKLVPRLVARLDELGIEDRETKRLRGIARFLWVQSEVHAEGARDAADFLARAGIGTVAIKGMALRSLVGPSYLRPMLDADLVLVGHIDQATRVLRGRGWKPRTVHDHAVVFARGKEELDLHRVAVRDDLSYTPELMPDETTEATRYRVATPTASVIIACLHGMRAGSGALWTLDVEELVKKTMVDWKDVTSFAAVRGFSLALRSLLARVPSVPEEVIADFDRQNVTYLEALEFRHLSTPHDRHGALAARHLRMLRSFQPYVHIAATPAPRQIYWDRRWVTEWR
jgi:hypothetical protein